MFQLSRLIELAIVMASILALSSCGHSNPEIHGENSGAVRVKVMPATAVGTSGSSLSDAYSGIVEPGSSTDLSFSVAGTISLIYVTEGQQVSKGQLIAALDGSSLKNANEIAEATLREAQDAYARMKRLHDAEALPDMQWVAVQEKLKQAEAAAGIARTEMDDANIYAPAAGVIARKLADVGQNTAPGLPIVELMDVNSLKVKISVPESDLSRMTSGTAAMVTAGNDNTQTYNATLTEKAVAANSLSRTYNVKFRIENPDEHLLPGMICSVSVVGEASASDPDAEIVLPPQAVGLDWDNESYVWLKKNGVACRQKVQIGGIDSRGIIISGGLTPADSVIVEGQQKLSSGLEVVAIN